LKYFESVVRNKKITKAAEELHISQPSLSAQIKNLEQMLGCKLIERNAREISLTEPGKVLYRHACNLLMQFENIYKEMEDVKEVGSGEIKIGMFPSCSYWFPQIIRLLKNKYPKIRIKINETGSENIENSLKNFDIHIGITSKFIHSDIFSYIPIYNEQLMLITYKDHPFKNLNEIDINKLSNETLILYKKGYQIRELILQSCNQAGFEPKFIYECGGYVTAHNMVISELGIAIVPETYLKFAFLKDVNVIKINNPTPKRTLYIVMQKKRYLQPVIHELNNLIINFFENYRDN
jgi:DNA-binding transcriptional LysR family regulator